MRNDGKISSKLKDISFAFPAFKTPEKMFPFDSYFEMSSIYNTKTKKKTIFHFLRLLNITIGLSVSISAACTIF